MRQASAPVTQERFAKLPGLLTCAEFMEVTGLGEHELPELRVTANSLSTQEIENVRRAGLLPVWRNHAGSGCAKYYKQDAAKIGGFKL